MQSLLSQRAEEVDDGHAVIAFSWLLAYEESEYEDDKSEKRPENPLIQHPKP